MAVGQQKGMYPGPTDGLAHGGKGSPGRILWDGPARRSSWMRPRSPCQVLAIHLPGEGKPPLNPPPFRTRQGVQGQEMVEEEQQLRRTLWLGCLGQRSLEPPGGQPRGRRLLPGAELSGLRWVCTDHPFFLWASQAHPQGRQVTTAWRAAGCWTWLGIPAQRGSGRSLGDPEVHPPQSQLVQSVAWS